MNSRTLALVSVAAFLSGFIVASLRGADDESATATVPAAPRKPVNKTRLVTRLVQATEELKLGGKMRFQVQIQNTTDKPLTIDAQHLGHFGSTHRLTNDKGQPIRCINPSESGLSTSQELHTIKPGKTLVVEKFDLGENFAIVKPGRYRLRLVGWAGPDFAGSRRAAVPGTKPVLVQIHPGKLTAAGELVKRIEPIVPRGWHLAVWPSGSLVLGHFPKEGGAISLTITGWKPGQKPPRNSAALCDSRWGKLRVNTYVGRAKDRRVPKGDLDDYWSEALEKLKLAIQK